MDILDWARAVAALAATLALIGGAAFAARRLGMVRNALPGAPRRMRVQERLMLDTRRTLVIVAIDGQERALLLSPFGDVDLAITAPAPSAPPPSPGEAP